MTLALNAPGVRSIDPEVRQTVRLAADAARVPVLRPLPLDAAATEGAPSLTAAPVGSVAITKAPERFEGPAPARVAAPVALAASLPTSTALQAGTWAVVIGVNDYPGSAFDLKFAVNDANDAVQALYRQGVNSDHILSLRDGQVTSDVVHSAVNWLNNHAGPDAVAVFFYAGHVKKVGGGEAMVTSDGVNITDTTLASWMRPLAARQTWITIAACYGGGFTELLGPGRVLTAAASANDLAYETAAFGRSYLGEYMIRRAMVEGAADATVQSAFNWARSTIGREYPDRVPVQYDNSDGNVNLRPRGSASQPTTPSQPAGGGPSAETPPPPETPPTTQPPRRCTGLIRINC